MAQLNFKIASAFDGEGFRAATQAINDNRKEINAAKTGLGDLTNALSNVSPAAATGANAVKTFAQAFATGGIVGGVIQLAIKGVSEAISYFTEKANAAKEATEKYADILRNELVGSLDETNSKFDETKSKVIDVKKDLDETVKLLNGDINAQVQNEIHRLHIEKLQQITDDMDESARKMLEEQYKGREAIVKANAAVEKATNVYNAASELSNKYVNLRSAAYKAEIEATEKYTAVQESCRDYIEKRNRLQDRLQNLEEAYSNELISTAEIRKDRKSIALQLQALEEEYKDDIKALADADEGLKQAKENVTTAEKDYESALRDSIDANKEVNNAQLALQEAEMEAAQSMKDAAQSVKEKVESADIKDLFSNVQVDVAFSDKIADLFADIPSNIEDIKESSQETKSNTKDIKRNQNKYGSRSSALTVRVDDFQPGQLPTLKEMKQQLEAQENAPRLMAEEAFNKYGYQTELMEKEIARAGDLTDEIRQKYEPLIAAIQNLPTDVAAMLMNKAGANLSLIQTDWHKFFTDFDQVKEWLTNGNGTGDSNPDDSSDLSGIEQGVGDIDTHLKECLALS